MIRIGSDEKISATTSPGRTGSAVWAAFGLLAAMAVLWGCLGWHRGEAGPIASPNMVRSPSIESGGTAVPAIPDLDQTMMGKPYRDLRRHTPQDLGEVSGIDVSPDGTSLLFSSVGDGSTPNLRLKKENEAGLVRKTSGPFWDIHPRFSPDGRSIAFASNRDGNFDLWIIPAEGSGGMEQVTSSPDDEVHPTWSPDGKKIAYSRLSRTHGWTLWMIDRVNGSVTELGPGLFPDWSPTGEWIAFQKPADREPRWFGLWIVRPDSSEVRQVLAGDGFWAAEPTWSPAGDLLAFTTAKAIAGDVRKCDGGRICVLELAHGKMYRVTDGPGKDSSPAWGIGGRIYFISDRLEGSSIWSLLPPEVKG